MKKKLFGKHISPACQYCTFGNPVKDSDHIFCAKRGAVDPYFSCRRFMYEPLKRVPKSAAALPELDPSEFQL